MNANRTGGIRQTAGQIELFAAILVVATMVVIGYVFFLVDSGACAFYKGKLQDMTTQGAAFAAGYAGPDAQQATQEFISSLASGMGLQANDLRVVVHKTSLNGQSATSCEATAQFPLLPNSIFPATVTLTGTSTMANPGTKPQILTLMIVGIGNQFLDKNAVVTGEVQGIHNKVVSAAGAAMPKPGSSGSSGTGQTSGIGNVNTGSGNVTGIGNIASGSGDTSGILNKTSGSGDTTGIGNISSGSGDTTGILNKTSGSGDTSGIGNHTSGTNSTTGILNNTGSGSGTVSGIGNSWN